MMRAAENGQLEVVRLLAEQKADLDEKGNYGKDLGEMRKVSRGGEWMWPSGINSAVETGKEGGEGKRIKFEWIRF